MILVKLLAVLAVCGAFAAKLALDWANGKRPFRASSDGADGGTSDWGHHGHHGSWAGDDGGDGDGGDGGGGH